MLGVVGQVLNISGHLPEWVSNYEKRHVFRIGISQNFVTASFDHITIRQNDLFLVESFLVRGDQPIRKSLFRWFGRF